MRPADARRNGGTDALRLGLDLDAGVLLGHPRGGDDHLREAVDLPRLPVLDPRGRVEVLQLAGEMDGEVGGVELLDRPGAALAGGEVLQKVSASFPSGVTAPTPVTTTRLRPFMLNAVLSLHP